MNRRAIALLGRRDSPTDGVEDYCIWLGRALEAHQGGDATLEGIKAADAWARSFMQDEIERLSSNLTMRP